MPSPAQQSDRHMRLMPPDASRDEDVDDAITLVIVCSLKCAWPMRASLCRSSWRTGDCVRRERCTYSCKAMHFGQGPQSCFLVAVCLDMVIMSVDKEIQWP
jgi:hypothetical protein